MFGRRTPAPLATPKRLLCFGDSLTWGWCPPEEPGRPATRYPRAERWPERMADELGAGFEVVVEALSGRTTNADDPTDPRLNGAAYLPAALASHLPLDLVILMIGTNDTKAWFGRSAFDVAAGAAVLLRQVATSAGGVGTAYPAPRALLVAPPPLGEIRSPWSREVFRDAAETSRGLAAQYEALAGHVGAAFLDAGKVLETGGADGIHFTAANNAALATAMAAKVRALLDA